MERCPICKRNFPDATESECGLDLITLAFIGGKHVETCPLCYADNIKRIHGIEWLPRGELAKLMYEEAKKLKGIPA